MKKGFTLIEMLVVVAVLALLTAISFRIGGISSQGDARNKTVMTMQKLENCLSGYYAAFGTYPPVKLHGDRSYLKTTNIRGLQDPDPDNEQEPVWKDEWNINFQVKAACMAQPVGIEFPFSGDLDMAQDVKDMSENLSLEASLMKADGVTVSERVLEVLKEGFDDGTSNIGRHTRNKDATDWREVELFKFGLLSYLLPRYLIMMNCKEEFFQYAQWGNNNSLPCDPITGSRFNSWKEIKSNYLESDKESDFAHVSNIPSQAACARWIANLEGLISASQDYTIYGVKVTTDTVGVGDKVSIYDVAHVYTPDGGGSDSTSGQYILDSMSIADGWGSDFYYYSPAPYQSYVLWSAGANRKTFPVWVSKEDLDTDAKAWVLEWTEDDIVSLSR